MHNLSRFFRMYGRMPYKYGSVCPVIYTSIDSSPIRVDLPEVWQWPSAMGREMWMRLRLWFNPISSKVKPMIPDFITKLVMPSGRNQAHQFFPTPELRFKKLREERGYGEKKETLQQKWINPITDDVQWRDIPVV